VQRVVLEQNVGDKVSLTVWRDGKEVELSVKTAELPAEAAARPERGGGEGKLGLALETLTPELAERLGADRATKGAVHQRRTTRQRRGRRGAAHGRR